MTVSLPFFLCFNSWNSQSFIYPQPEKGISFGRSLPVWIIIDSSPFLSPGNTDTGRKVLHAVLYQISRWEGIHKGISYPVILGTSLRQFQVMFTREICCGDNPIRFSIGWLFFVSLRNLSQTVNTKGKSTTANTIFKHRLELNKKLVWSLVSKETVVLRQWGGANEYLLSS